MSEAKVMIVDLESNGCRGYQEGVGFVCAAKAQDDCDKYESNGSPEGTCQHFLGDADKHCCWVDKRWGGGSRWSDRGKDKPYGSDLFERCKKESEKIFAIRDVIEIIKDGEFLGHKAPFSFYASAKNLIPGLEKLVEDLEQQLEHWGFL